MSEQDLRRECLDALAEIDSRLRPETPDLSLGCDRGLVHELQGNHAAALADFKDIRKIARRATSNERVHFGPEVIAERFNQNGRPSTG